MSMATQEDITVSAFDEMDRLRYLVGDPAFADEKRHDHFVSYLINYCPPEFIKFSVEIFFTHGGLEFITGDGGIIFQSFLDKVGPLMSSFQRKDWEAMLERSPYKREARAKELLIEIEASDILKSGVFETLYETTKMMRKRYPMIEIHLEDWVRGFVRARELKKLCG